ncbi:MAG: hypothetical protein Q8O41_01900 [Candidatus Methanoperedens sp.]|nr:hypothetical protein [Candidatus Methanoperedens sp.]
MSKDIKKLNQLKNPRSYLQVNLVKGFKYVDKAGAILNEYLVNNEPPLFNMNLDGLHLISPKEKISEMRITPKIIWGKYQSNSPLDEFARIFNDEIKKIISILEVNEINRIGWRNYFIYNFQNDNEQKEYFDKLSSLKNSKISSVKLEINTGNDFKANLGILPLVKDDESKTPAVLFDIDIYKLQNFKVEDVSTCLRNFREYLQDKNGFLDFINKTF